MALPKQEFIISAKDQTKQAFDSVIGSVGKVTGILGTLGVSVSFAAILKSAADFADEMDEVAQKLGVTTESISALKYAAEIEGISFEGLQVGLKKLSQNAFEAADGNKALSEDFKRLGIDVLNTSGALKSSDTILLELAEKFANMKDGAEKTALAVKLLGKSGSDLIPFLNQGREGLKAYTDEARRFGLVVDGETAAAAAAFNDNLAKLQAAGRGLAVEIGSRLIPSLSKTTVEIVAAVKEGRNLEAVLLGIAEISKTPYNFFLGAVDSTVDTKDRINELNAEIKDLESTLIKTQGGGLINKALFGSKEEIEQKIKIAKNQLEGFIKFGEQIDKNSKKVASVATPDTSDPFAKTASTGKSKAVLDAEAAAKAAQAFTDKLVEQAATLGLSDEALLRYELSQQKLTKSQLAAAESAITQITAFKQNQQALKDALEDEKIFKEGDDRELQALEEQSRLEQEIIAAREADYENFYNNLTSLNEQLNIDLITNDTQRAQAQIDLENQRAIERIQNLGLENEQIEILLNEQAEIYAKQTKQLAEQGTSDFDDLKRAVRGFGDDAARTLTEFVTTGKADFGDLVESILSDLARLALQKKVLEPIFESFDGFLDGFDFGSFFTANAKGNVYSGAGINRYSNSIVDRPTIFPFAKGIGLMGEAGAEAILPLTRVGGDLGVKADGIGSNVTVNIIGAPSTPTVKQSRDQSGGFTIDVMFEQVENFMAKRVARGDGAMANVIEGRYGLTPGYGAAG